MHEQPEGSSFCQMDTERSGPHTELCLFRSPSREPMDIQVRVISKRRFQGMQVGNECNCQGLVLVRELRWEQHGAGEGGAHAKDTAEMR